MLLAGCLLAGLTAGALQPVVLVRADEVSAASDLTVEEAEQAVNDAEAYLNAVLEEYAQTHPEEAQKLREEAQSALEEAEKAKAGIGAAQNKTTENEVRVNEAGSTAENKSASHEEILSVFSDGTARYYLTGSRVIKEDLQSRTVSLIMPLADSRYTGLYADAEKLILLRPGAEDVYRFAADRTPVFTETRREGDASYFAPAEQTPSGDGTQEGSPADQLTALMNLQKADSLLPLPNTPVRQINDAFLIRSGNVLYRLGQEAAVEAENAGPEVLSVLYEPAEGEKLLSATSWGDLAYVLLERPDGTRVVRAVAADRSVRDIYGFEQNADYTQVLVSDGVISFSSENDTKEALFRLGAGGLFGSLNMVAGTSLDELLPSVREEAGKEMAAADQGFENVISELQGMLEQETDADKAARIQESIDMLSVEKECQYSFPVCALTGGVFSSAYQMTRLGRIYLIEDGLRLIEVNPDAPEGSRRIVYPIEADASLITITDDGVLYRENGQIFRMRRTAQGFEKTLYMTTDAELVFAGEDSLTLGEWKETEDGVPVYVLSRADLAGGTIGELFRSAGDLPAPEEESSFPLYTECSGRIFYRKTVSGRQYLFERSEQALKEEYVMGGAVSDSGCADAGISEVIRYYAAYAGNETGTAAAGTEGAAESAGEEKLPELVIGLQIPAFSGDYEGAAAAGKLFESRLSGFLTTALTAMNLDPADSALKEISFNQYRSFLDRGVAGAAESMGELTWADERYVSFAVCDRLTPAGSARSVYANDYYVLDMERGKRLLLKDVVRTGHDELKELVVSGISRQAALAPQSFYEDAADRAGAVSPDNYQFYLSKGGLCVEFAAGELAPYTEGVKTVLIPYEQIALWIVPGKGLSEEDE